MTSIPACPTAPHPSNTSVPTDVETLMARMAAGDRAAVFELADHHGHRIRGEVYRQLRYCGVERRVAVEDMDGLVLDAAIAILDVAGAWRPEGALPWTWARDRIRGVVSRWVGVHADALDADHRIDVPDAPPVVVIDEDLDRTFSRLAEEVPMVRLIAEAAAAAQVDEPALYCLLEYRIQQSSGDPSPAHTLAPRYGVSPQTLRQRVSRNRRRLRHVVTTEPRYAELSGSAIVA